MYDCNNNKIDLAALYWSGQFTKESAYAEILQVLNSSNIVSPERLAAQIRHLLREQQEYQPHNINRMLK
jgi:hypothetical protein